MSQGAEEVAEEVIDTDFETVIPASYSLDGAPDHYRQLYLDDVGPFQFPIPSEFITKRLTTPPTELLIFKRGIVSAFSWLIPFGIIAVGMDFFPVLLVAAFGFIYRLHTAWIVYLGVSPFALIASRFTLTRLPGEAIATGQSPSIVS